MNTSETTPTGLSNSASSEEQQPVMSQIREPTTPSLKKSSSFTSHPYPQTPERTPHQLTSEETHETPLLSPTAQFNSTTPSKRRSTDFYSLLKSPDLNRNDDLKRRSLELNKIINKSPDKLNNYIFHDNALKSPKRQAAATFRVHKKNDTEIKEISENLKTRLNYANVKIQHGWSAKSISELEKNLEEEKSRKLLTSKDKEQHQDFWNLKSDQLPTYTQPATSPSHKASAPSTPRRKTSRLKLDEVASKQGSAESALYKALSPERPKLKIDSAPILPPINNHHRSASDSKLEQEAIMSLISLSSPVKYSGSQSPSPPRPVGLQKPPTLHFERPRRRAEESTDEETELEDESSARNRIFRSPPRNGLKGLGLSSRVAADDDDKTASDYSE
ncbi:hypothetical protein OGAPHI_001613 [Ogataea philodendri]|uniref:Uncharacterized protein n=1 Tax=Ogataea philodendri TaxID=1378263 RepID=A0A9P8PDV8_9ASCO|nr:uncharacterized protein OGAPHI_001613 [Ogataea philodendri]KAH3669492.1 hypothetical protein OGAPHI_001613 [Ogataea philodendri]